ncbi:hypothetical protein WN71_005240 [Streptomyces mangrovisoli]|uniref:Uncharacterized protein n=1 Tax=Streptomyces mangrovisoli TaxID=1428628 RepID=A0A1J4P5S3_9ACTN|nr:hypothetical protein WN71_005240 [Streptomyces mangrovisoli]
MLPRIQVTCRATWSFTMRAGPGAARPAPSRTRNPVSAVDRVMAVALLRSALHAARPHTRSALSHRPGLPRPLRRRP